MQLAFIREEHKDAPWVDLYNTDTKQSFPLSRFKRDDEAEYYCKNVNLVLGNLTMAQIS